MCLFVFNIIVEVTESGLTHLDANYAGTLLAPAGLYSIWMPNMLGSVAATAGLYSSWVLKGVSAGNVLDSKQKQ